MTSILLTCRSLINRSNHFFKGDITLALSETNTKSSTRITPINSLVFAGYAAGPAFEAILVLQHDRVLGGAFVGFGGADDGADLGLAPFVADAFVQLDMRDAVPLTAAELEPGDLDEVFSFSLDCGVEGSDAAPRRASMPCALM